MILLAQKLSRPFKFSLRLESDHHRNSSDGLRNFRLKISNFITQICFKTDPGFDKCFELINITNQAFAKMVTEIDYPMTRWGEKLTDEYLSYTLNLLDLLNSVNSSLSHLNQAKITIFHALTLIKSSPSKHLKKKKKKKIPISMDFKFERSIRIEDRPGSEKERVVLQALAVAKKIEFLAIGRVLSGLCSDTKPYMEIRKCAGGFNDDSLIKELDSRFCKEVTEVEGKMEEVKEVNSATERLSAAISIGSYTELAVEELKTTLKVLEISIQGLEKQANNLFSQVLATRNKLLDNLRLTGGVQDTILNVNLLV